MDWSKFLTPEAVAAYVTFLGTAIITSLGWIIANKLSKKKPNIVRVSRESATSLLEIPTRLRAKVKVTFNQIEVPAIFQTQFEVINLGEDVIENPSFSIKFSAGNVVDIIIEDPLEAARKANSVVNSSEGTINLPFLNPYGSLKDKLKVTILSNGKINNLSCVGGGKAWKVEYVDMLELRSKYVALLAQVNPRNPKWAYQYLSASIELFTKLLKF